MIVDLDPLDAPHVLSRDFHSPWGPLLDPGTRAVPSTSQSWQDIKVYFVPIGIIPSFGL
jgi:hypothetical protein